MYIKQLSLVNFKSYEEATVVLHPKVNCFVGDNGVGKTNLLDAVYYICMCKSYFQGTDAFSVYYNRDFMVLQANFDALGENVDIYCGLKTGKRKIFKKNKKEYQKLSEHIGQFPVVMVSPSDSALILDGGEERRRYMNAVISQYNAEYLEASIQYNKVLVQRNKFLKEMMHQRGAADLLAIYDEQLIALGEKIHTYRHDFVEKLSPKFEALYKGISQGREKVSIRYASQLNEANYGDLFKQSHQADLLAQTTRVGVHKDDLELLMNDMPIKKVGSQGQQKTFLVALKLAQFDFLKEIGGIAPILLLDDIFDKFDGGRVKQILEIVSKEDYGQIFITHTNAQRMSELLSEFEGNYSMFKVENGIVYPTEK